jgi:hypothetical protein
MRNCDHRAAEPGFSATEEKSPIDPTLLEDPVF